MRVSLVKTMKIMTKWSEILIEGKALKLVVKMHPFNTHWLQQISNIQSAADAHSFLCYAVIHENRDGKNPCLYSSL